MEYRQLTAEECADIQSRILYEDNHLLIVNKKVGEITQGDKTGDECLAELMKAYIAERDGKPGKVFMGIPHRLDRPVSGIVVFAKTSKALSRLSEMFRTGQMHKSYWALCIGEPAKESGELVNWLLRNEKANKSFVVKAGTPGAKEARLLYKLTCQVVLSGCDISGSNSLNISRYLIQNLIL